jgi:hypothetical protein
MTEEEAWALEDEVTRNPPKVSGNGENGFFAKRKEATLVFVDDVSAAWLRVTSEITHKSSTEIIGELVRERIAAQFTA